MDPVCAVSPDEVAYIRAVNGGKVAGLRAVAARLHGRPAVVRVAAVVGGRPFPTLFWLVDPDLVRRISVEEAAGRIAEFQSRVDADTELQASMEEDHRAYIALRLQHMTPEEKEEMNRRGFMKPLTERGVGGLEKFDRIRCLHTWYGAHMVVPNTIGKMLDEYWAAQSASSPSKPIGGGLLPHVKLSYSQWRADPGSDESLAKKLKVLDSAVPYLDEARNFRKELLEAEELARFCIGECIVDLGCSHGMASYLIAALRPAGETQIVWIDKDSMCRAARYADQLGVPFYSKVSKDSVPEKAVLLMVNVCGTALLELIESCRELHASPMFCVVPCCGPNGEEGYDSWVSTVREAIGAPTETHKLKHNFGRTAIVSIV